jgi:hypothetical protein
MHYLYTITSRLDGKARRGRHLSRRTEFKEKVLPPETIDLIRFMAGEGCSPSKIARCSGVSRYLVSKHLALVV